MDGSRLAGALDGIYPRVFVPFLLALAGVTATAWWVATSLIGHALEDRQAAQLTHAAQMLAAGSIPLTDEVLGRFVSLQEADFAVVDHEGTVTLSTWHIEMRAAFEALVGGLPAAHADGAFAVVTTDAGEPFMVVRKALDFPAGGSGAAVFAFGSLTSVRAAESEAARWMSLVAVVLGVLLAVAGHRLAKGITRPIDSLARMAQRIAAGDRAVRADVTRPRELALLGESLNDMTQRLAEYEHRSAEQNRLAALGELAARVAHEIRNPLTAIKMQVAMMSEWAPGSATASRCERLLDEIRRLELIVTGTLQLSRTQQLDRRNTDLDQLVREVCLLLTPQFAHRKVVLETALASPPELAVDADRIKQVVFNLLINAAEALPDGGRVVVRSRCGTDFVELSVEDDGPGIPPEMRQNLFRHAVRGKNHGLGIGLMLCREIVDLHGGSITAGDSGSLGGGSVVVRLPLAPIGSPQ